MIRMVDKDGDGQVSFDEFYKMVLAGEVCMVKMAKRKR